MRGEGAAKKVLRHGAGAVILCAACLGAMPPNLTDPPQEYPPSSSAFPKGENLMKKSEIRILDMLRCTRQHGQQRAAAFPANSRGHELYATVGTSIVNMERHSAEQATHHHAYREKSAQKNVAEEAL